MCFCSLIVLFLEQFWWLNPTSMCKAFGDDCFIIRVPSVFPAKMFATFFPFLWGPNDSSGYIGCLYFNAVVIRCTVSVSRQTTGCRMRKVSTLPSPAVPRVLYFSSPQKAMYITQDGPLLVIYIGKLGLFHPPEAEL